MANVNVTLYDKAGNHLFPASVGTQIAVNNAQGQASNVDAEIVALRTAVNDIVSGTGLVFKGSLTADNGLPTEGYKAGWQYVVGEAGTYAGQVCEEGDMVVCIHSYEAPETPPETPAVVNADWAVIQKNIDGAVTGPAQAAAQHVATFADASGKTLADSGFTIGASVPADAKFTDTTYAAATDKADGLLTKEGFVKLNNLTQGITSVVAGAGIAVAVEGTEVTVSEQFVDTAIVSNLDDVPANLRDGGLVILKA